MLRIQAELELDAAIGRLVREFGSLDEMLHNAISNIVLYGSKGSSLNKRDLDLFTKKDRTIDGALKRRFVQFRRLVRAIDLEKIYLSDVDRAMRIFDDLVVARNCICHSSSRYGIFVKHIELRRDIKTTNKIFNYESTTPHYFYLTVQEIDAISDTVADVYNFIKRTEIDIMYKYSYDYMWTDAMMFCRNDLRRNAWFSLRIKPSPWNVTSKRGSRPRPIDG